MRLRRLAPAGLRWRDRSWVTKLGLLLAFLAIGPLTLVTLYNDATTRRELLDAARTQNLQQAANTAKAIDDYLRQVLADLRLVARSPAAVRLLAEGPGGGRLAEARQVLADARVLHGFEALYLLGPAGDVVTASGGRFAGRNYIAARYFLTAMSGKAAVDAPRMDPEDGRVFLHLSAPVRVPGARLLGAAVGRLTPERLDEIAAADTNFAGRHEFGILWDDLGIRLSHPTKPALRYRPFEPLAPEVASALVAERRFGTATARLLAAPEPVRGLVERSRWLFYDRATNPHLRIELVAGHNFAASLAPLASQRWVYGIFTPEDDLLGAVRRQTRRNLLLGLAVALAAAGLAVAAARWVTRPLRLVGEAANAIAEGDLSRRVGLVQGDEVGRLAAAFDAMADAVAEKEAELRDHAARLEQRVAERTAREQEERRKAEEANRLKDEFLSTVSHELRTPLNAILGWIWLLQSGKLDSERFGRALATIEKNARAQSQIIDDLLDVSRVITGKLLLEPRRIDLLQVVEAALDGIRPAAQAKEIALTARLDPAAGPAFGDPQRLQQVVWNLLSNAVKFTPRGGRVEVALERVDSQAEIRVADTGMGIPPEFLGFVFDRFRQADSSTTRQHGGLGLGLSIVRHLVELHGGTVHAESAGEGRGATFTVRLPMPAAPRLPGGAEPESPAAEEAGSPLAGLRLLLVDDDPEAREVIPAVLESYGALVRTAASAEEAVADLARSPADVLIADIGMPGEDGYALIRRLRALDGLPSTLPAIALTAYAGEADRKLALDAGFDLHLAKPVAPDALAAAVTGVARRPAGG